MIEPDVGEPGVNPLIFIDEVHDLLNSGHPESAQLYSLLKNLSDPDQREITDLGLGATIDLSKATFIFGANARPSQDRDTANALNSRLITVEFPPLNGEQKKIVATRSFSELSEKYSYHPNSGDARMIDDMVAADSDPGARILKKVIEDYILYQVASQQGRIESSPFDIVESFHRNGQKPN